MALAEEDASAEELSTEELLPHRKERWCSRTRWTLLSVVASVAAGCSLIMAVVRPRPQTTSTVGEFMEGAELTDAITDNFMAVGRRLMGAERRGEVREAVVSNLANISRQLREWSPEDHARMGTLELTQEQKSSVLRLLRFYSDPRVQSLPSSTAQAIARARASGGPEGLHQRIAAELQPQLRELRELFHEMAPGQSQDFKLSPEDLEELVPQSEFDKWHMQFSITPVEATDKSEEDYAAGLLAGRRLTADDTLGGTRDQTSTVYQHLEGVLGDRMPQAPARMLFFEKQKEKEKGTTGIERFISCITDEYTKGPKAIFDCLMTNCSRAMTWLMKKAKEYAGMLTNVANR